MLAISRDILNDIVQKCNTAAPHEACGLLFGGEGVVSGWSLTENVAADPYRHFEIDPAALIAALRAEREGGARVAGYWHSHPSGDARPSAIDAASAAPDGRLWLILAGGEAAIWRAVAAGAVHGRFDPVELAIT
ncbi:M67 family metallopeptidase [Sphingomonas sp. BT-65]|uniref:M67 family metallopeptidase n=1 Tax=Sphingomonas sp. BT-65 TaxID=2989821 RepID=UPI002236838F|nr:M67 family metallopeptidase [Sphingomonas sp. BT-65]MCW4461080.1 M67 family metallopeptidase [Sphingomonas sp. BT-65]